MLDLVMLPIGQTAEFAQTDESDQKPWHSLLTAYFLSNFDPSGSPSIWQDIGLNLDQNSLVMHGGETNGVTALLESSGASIFFLHVLPRISGCTFRVWNRQGRQVHTHHELHDIL